MAGKGTVFLRMGGYEPIDVNDLHAIDLAKFAVEEHNKQAHTHLMFIDLVRGEVQIVAGRNYMLVVRAINGIGGPMHSYLADLYEGLDGQRVLKSFTFLITYIPQPGGWQPIEDVKEVEAIGRFAVNEHNKQAHTHLKFEEVVKGEIQIVEGINYKLILRAIIEEEACTYMAFVFEDLKRHMSLIDFVPSN
ncbi:hypothetical protein Sjap_009032 [Stephania japonica]|uniref:Cystatin domain-containing protein n=1 Tax=Stephania japonica TaxID=461633 RepID=A0AAP0JS70_9MAGN